jgi:hypothetical protein
MEIALQAFYRYAQTTKLNHHEEHHESAASENSFFSR